MGALRLTYHNSNLIASSSLELTSHLNNVLSVISDKPIPHPSGSTVAYYKADILQSQDFSPFGVKLKNRVFNKTGNTELYRSGFQGQEEDDELKGDGNSLNYEYRMHDPRLGRFFAIDPLAKSYSELSVYQFSSNSPIFMIELEGAEGKLYITTQWMTNKGVVKTKTKVHTVEGLKADVIKICWKGHSNPNGPVIEIDYFGRRSDGSSTGNGMTGIKVDQKPSVAELNAMFSSDPMNSYNVKKEEIEDKKREAANKHWYDGTIAAPGGMEGNDDGANNGGEYGGVDGMRASGELLKDIGKVAQKGGPYTALYGRGLEGLGYLYVFIADCNDPKLEPEEIANSLSIEGVKKLTTSAFDRAIKASGVNKIGQEIVKEAFDQFIDNTITTPEPVKQ